MHAIALAAVLVAATFTTACDDPEEAADAGAVDCSSETRADPWSADLQKEGSLGLVLVRIVDATPEPPSRFDNIWTLEVSDPDGAPLDEMGLTVEPFMPDHGHGTPVVPEVTALGDGEYRVGMLSLWMPGLWEVRIAIDTGEAVDHVVFRYCIDE